MDLRALGELIWFAFLGLSVFALTSGLVIRFVLRPFVQELLDAYRERSDRLPSGDVAEHVRLMEGRLAELDAQVRTLRAGADFDRQLRPSEDEPGEPG